MQGGRWGKSKVVELILQNKFTQETTFHSRGPLMSVGGEASPKVVEFILQNKFTQETTFHSRGPLHVGWAVGQVQKL